MNIQHVGPHIHAALAALRAGLPDAISEFNAEDGIQLKVPVDSGGPLGDPDVAYHFGGKPRHTLFPAVEVAVPDGTVDGLAIDNVDADLEAQVVATVWVEAPAEEFSERYERAIGYGRCLQHVLLQPDAFGPSVEVKQIRFAYAANPDRRNRDDMEAMTIGSFHFFTIADVEER